MGSAARVLAAVVAVSTTGLSAADARPLPQYRGSATEAAERKAGRRTVRVLRVDVNGDGRRDDAVVQTVPGGLRLAVMVYRRGDPESDEDAFQIVFAETVRPAQRVSRLEAAPIAGALFDDIVAVFEASSPDERVTQVRIMGRRGATLKTFLAKTFLAVAETGSGSKPSSKGSGIERFVLRDLDRDGTQEVLWTTGAQTITVDGQDGPLRIAVGVRRQTLRFDPRLGVYPESGPEQVVDLLPPHRPTDVEASIQVPKIWGTAQAFWGADGDLETAWTVPGASFRGQTLTLRFGTPRSVSMIRVVPGCGGNAGEWARYRTVDQFRIQLSNGLRFDVRVDGKGPWPAGVRGRGVFTLEGDFGRQVLLFIEDPAVVSWARLELLAASPAGSGRRSVDEVCVSEISVH